MEPTYTILGSDGKQYGPVTAEQLRGWVRDGRVGGDTQVWRSDSPSWASASTLPELGVTPSATASPPPVHAAAPVHDVELERRVKSGASWFYWIAGFSIVNSIMAAANQPGGWALGLGVTTFTDAAAPHLGGAGKSVAFAFGLVAAGLMVLFGFFAGKGHAWAFIVGMVLLGLDTVLTGVFRMWISLAIHVFALFCIFAGFKASRALRA